MSGSSRGRLHADVVVENLGGHKLPTAYPSRRAWLHVIVRDRSGPRGVRIGRGASRTARSRATTTTRTRRVRAALRRDPQRPTRCRSTRAIIGGCGRRRHDRAADRRAVHEGQPAAAARIRQGGPRSRTSRCTATRWTMPDFTGAGDRVRYSVAAGERAGSVRRRGGAAVSADRLPLGEESEEVRRAAEPRRFIGYYDAMGKATTALLGAARRSQ